MREKKVERRRNTKSRKIDYPTIWVYDDDNDCNSCTEKESEKEFVQDTSVSLRGDVLVVRIKNEMMLQ